MLVFLNDDTLPQMGWLPPLLRTFREHPDVGAVGGKLLYPDGSLQEAGNVVFADGRSELRPGRYGADDPLSATCAKSTTARARCSRRRAAVPEIGGFDERYSPAYYEDTDYCFAVRAGARVSTSPRASSSISKARPAAPT